MIVEHLWPVYLNNTNLSRTIWWKKITGIIINIVQEHTWVSLTFYSIHIDEDVSLEFVRGFRSETAIPTKRLKCTCMFGVVLLVVSFNQTNLAAGSPPGMVLMFITTSNQRAYESNGGVPHVIGRNRVFCHVASQKDQKEKWSPILHYESTNTPDLHEW